MATSHLTIGDNLAITGYKLDTASAVSAAAGWVDMRDFQAILCLYTRVVGTGVLTEYRIDASTASNGANPVTVKTGTATTVDAVGDFVKIEVSQREIAAALAGARYVSLVVIHPTATEKAGVTYVRKGKVGYSGLTADTIA